MNTGMKENQVSFSFCNPNTTQKQLKGEWVCFGLDLQVACPSWEGRYQSRWLPGGWSVQGGPLFCFCSRDSSLFLSSVVRLPPSLWVVLSLSSLLAPHGHSQRCVSRKPLIQSTDNQNSPSRCVIWLNFSVISTLFLRTLTLMMWSYFPLCII